MLPWLTLADPGLMEPPDPAVAVTVYAFRLNVAVTVQLLEIAPVV